MLTPQQLSDAFARNVAILKNQAAGLSHADSLIQPPVRGNCLNWVLGHLVENRNSVLAAVGLEATTDPALLARYRRESAPVLAERDARLTLEELLAALDRSQESLAARLATIGGEELARERPFAGRTRPGDQLLFFLYFHETYHVGQAELLRQLAGKDDKVI